MSAVAAMLTGDRLHLQHGPIDLVIGADGEREEAFAAAKARFATVLEELVAELDLLRLPFSRDVPEAVGETARIMQAAVTPLSAHWITPMAAVAGAVAETVLHAMTDAARLRRAYVNNGGDIALHLTGNQTFDIAIAGLDGQALGRVRLTGAETIRGIATSGRGGRSLSLGIADSVSVLAPTAALADAAATLIANAVDLPGHPGIPRRPAYELRPDTDLGDRMVPTGPVSLSPDERSQALDNGAGFARKLVSDGLISGAFLQLDQAVRVIGDGAVALPEKERIAHA